MAKKKAPAKKAGRNEIDIDWKQAAYLCECGALGTEVSASLGIHERTLYTRCKKDKGVDWSVFMYENRAKGDTLLKRTQYETAIQLQDKAMLVWLGKNRLGQKDKHDVTSNDETVKPSWTINVVDPTKE